MLIPGVITAVCAALLPLISDQGYNVWVALAVLFAGWLLLHEKLTERELTGCVLMFCGMVLSQLPIRFIRLSLTRRANDKPPF